MITKIKWHDCHSFLGWASGSPEHEGIAIVESIGYLVKETDEYIALATSICDDGDSSTRTYIPKGCVIEQKILNG